MKKKKRRALIFPYVALSVINVSNEINLVIYFFKRYIKQESKFKTKFIV